jgi:hypothetical protein
MKHLNRRTYRHSLTVHPNTSSDAALQTQTSSQRTTQASHGSDRVGGIRSISTEGILYSSASIKLVRTLKVSRAMRALLVILHRAGIGLAPLSDSASKSNIFKLAVTSQVDSDKLTIVYVVHMYVS